MDVEQAGERQAILDGAAALGVPLSEVDAARLAQLIEELARWNHAFNLTAIELRADMVSRHVLDSLSAQPEITGERVADLGSGAGFPGLPLAVVNPARRFTLIDSAGKKLRFIAHAARLLQLGNVETLHARVEELAPERPFDCVIARAFAPLPRLLAWARPLCGPATRVVAMHGRWGEDNAADVPTGWRVAGVRRVEVPGLAAERHLVTLELMT